MIANAKRRRNYITNLEINGMDVFNQESIREEINDYYTNIFTATNSINPSFDNMGFNSLDDTQRNWL